MMHKKVFLGVYRSVFSVFIFLLLLPAIFSIHKAYADAEDPDKGQGAIYDPPDDQMRAEYDPYRGVDRTGRIPKIDLPGDIAYPERWRYIPEGRIKPGNALERFLVSTFIIPVVFYEQDVGAGGGLSLFDLDFRQQRRREFAGIGFTYTTEGQEAYGIGWRRYLHHRELESGGVILEERSHVQAGAAYVRTLTRRFFGYGPESSEQNESSYTDETTAFLLGIQQSFPEQGDDFIYTMKINWENRNLASGHVSDIPSTDDAFPDVFQRGDEYEILWIGGSLAYDTRDSQHNPYKGWTVKMNTDWAPVQTGEGMAAKYEMTGNWVYKVPGLFHNGGDINEEHPPTDVISVGAQLEWVDGDLPFWALPTLGGTETLRGYIANRFTDRSLWHCGAEYRFWTHPRGFRITDSVRVERLGMALFYEMGTVSEGLSTLWSENVKHSYGVSFRFTLERMALFRADIGFADEGVNVTLAFGNSF